ncbi:hypothetical protein Q9233_002368 [Columba guinea]|nr:hypothetical protein Q9233_002368 [Columba guinea]
MRPAGWYQPELLDVQEKMGKRKFSGLEVTLIALFCLVVCVACVLIGLLASGQSGVKTPGKCFFPLLL